MHSLQLRIRVSMIIMELILNELQKAVMENVTGGFGSQGGSTITQQVVKKLLSNDGQNC